MHLAFMITGSTASREAIRAINVDGTLNASRAAAAAGAKRFVYASSVAAYGFHRDNPKLITAEWPTRPASHLFYVGQAFLQCIVAAGPLGAYNITGDGVLTGTEVARELGWRPRYTSLETLRDTIAAQ